MTKDKQRIHSAITYLDYLAVTCFFISGFTSLVYEICWIRKASLVFGATTLAVSSVIAIFFLGLALGSYTFGRYTQKTVTPLKIYAVLEMILGIVVLFNPVLFRMGERIFGLAYPFIFHRFFLLSLTRFFMLSILLLPPAILIGGTFPLFCRQYVRCREKISLSVGILYVINTLGAAAGTIVCGLYLVPRLGVNTTILICGMINITIGIVMYVLKFSKVQYTKEEMSEQESVRTTDTETTDGLPLFGSRTGTYIAVLFFLSGFVALSNEIIWIRFLSLIVHNTVYTYTITLATILIGIVIGALLVSLVSKLIHHRAFFFGMLHMGIGLCVLVILLLPAHIWNAVRDTQHMSTLILIVSMILLIPSVLSGMSFPLAIRIFIGRPELAGIGVGKMSAVNTIGGVLGSLCIGFIIVPLLGMQKGVFITTGISIGIGCLAIGMLAHTVKPVVRFGVIAGICTVWLVLPHLLKTRLPADYLAEKERLIDFREGVGGHLAVVKNRYDIPVLEIDRMWQGEEKVSHQIMAAHVPMILHQNPEQVLVIGAGVGQTASRFLYYPLQRLDCVDIEKELFTLIRSYFDAQWMDDTRVACIVEDGRNFITHTDRTYDIISIEIGQIFRPGCASFYTGNFYRSAGHRLKPGGLICQFVPLVFLDKQEFLSVIRTFIEVFPNSTLWYNRNEFLLIGAINAQPVLTEKRLALLENNSQVHQDLAYYYWGGPNNALHKPEVFSAGFLYGPKSLKRLTESAQVYYDDIPALEYTSAEIRKHTEKNSTDILHMIQQAADNPETIFAQRIPGTLMKKIEHIRRYNLRNITAVALFRRYLEKKNKAPLLQAFEQNPYNYDISFHLGQMFAQEENAVEAEKYFRQTLVVYPEHANAQYNLGLMQLKQGYADSALIHFYETIRLVPDHAQAYNTIGVILARHGEYEKAIEHFSHAIKNNPDNKSALKNQEKARQKLQMMLETMK